jgi:hypothetical protein
MCPIIEAWPIRASPPSVRVRVSTRLALQRGTRHRHTIKVETGSECHHVLVGVLGRLHQQLAPKGSHRRIEARAQISYSAVQCGLGLGCELTERQGSQRGEQI